MTSTNLNQEIMLALLQYHKNSGDRQFTRFYRLINQHPNLNHNSGGRYLPELFKEGVQEAWLIFYCRNLSNILEKLEAEGIVIAPENATVIVNRIIQHLNLLIRNKNVDLWRKETIPSVA